MCAVGDGLVFVFDVGGVVASAGVLYLCVGDGACESELDVDASVYVGAEAVAGGDATVAGEWGVGEVYTMSSTIGIRDE